MGIFFMDELKFNYNVMKKLRKKNKLTLMQLCSLTSLSWGVIQQLEKGKEDTVNRIKLKTINKIAKVLDVNPKRLIIQ
jgi:transcriptional regulator with XRE-family HTH domain